VSETQEDSQPAVHRGLYWGAWVVAIALVVLALYLGWRVSSAQAGVSEQTAAPVSPKSPQSLQSNNADLSLPQLSKPVKQAAISRQINLHTIIPTRPRQDAQDYTVETGDSVFAIAKSFGLEPESVLWANYILLNDNPDQLSPGSVVCTPECSHLGLATLTSGRTTPVAKVSP